VAGVGDIDQDGTVDLIWRNETKGLLNYWLLNSGGTQKATGRISEIVLPAAWIVAGVGDIDQDGTVDLIWRNETKGLVNYWLLNSDGTRKSGGRILEGTVSDAWTIAGVGDIDLDGTVDLIWRNEEEGLLNYWLLDSDGTQRAEGQVLETTLSASWFVAGTGG
jgi:hypothetical protein